MFSLSICVMHLLVTVNAAAIMNMTVQIFVISLKVLWYLPRSGIDGSYCTSVLVCFNICFTNTQKHQSE